MINTLPIILGSSSKFRQKVLKSLGYEFTILSPEIDEKAIHSNDGTLDSIMGLSKTLTIRLISLVCTG